MDIKGGNIVQGQPDSEQLNSHTFPKLPVYATIGRRSMARVHLAQGFETPIWTGSPQGVVCFTTSSPSSKAGAFTERKNSKRWSFYGGSGNSKRDSSSHNGNDKMTSRKKGNKSHEHRNGVNGVSGNGKCPPPSPLRLTPEPEDITDRLCLRRRWTTRESSKRPVNVFEPQTHDGDDTEPGKKIPLWKAVNANISSEDNPVVPVSSQSLMYSWKGKESPPDVPDSRQILSDDPVSSLMRSPKPTRSLSVESTISTSGSSTISNTRSLSLRRTNCPSLLGSYLASSEGNDGDDDKSGSALALIRKKPSLRKIELPKLENHMPSLDQVKALLLEEARNLSDTVRAIPMPSRPSSSQEGTADLSLAKRVGAASSTSNLLAKLSGSFVTNSDTISPDQKHKVISVPVIQTMPLLHRNHSLKLHDRPNSNFKPLIRRKPTIYNGKLNQNNSAEGADVRPTSKPNSVTSTVISDAPQRLTSRSSNSSDSQCAALSSLSASTTSSLYTERGASDQQPLLSALTSNDDRNRPVDIRHDIDDVLIMDLLKNLNINANEKNLLRQTSKQRQCQCISPPPSIQEQRSRGKTVASASIKHQQGLHCIVPIEDPHSSGNTVLTNSENEQDAQDYADASSVQRPSYDPSVSSSGPSISSDLLLDKGDARVTKTATIISHHL